MRRLDAALLAGMACCLLLALAAKFLGLRTVPEAGDLPPQARSLPDDAEVATQDIEPEGSPAAAVAGDVRPSSPETPAPNGAIAAPTVVVRGSLLVAEASGHEFREENGTIRFDLLEPQGDGVFRSGRVVVVEVARGRWSLAAPEGWVAELLGGEIGCRPTLFQEAAFAISGQEAELTAVWPQRPTRLHFVDATTRAELSGLILVNAHVLNPMEEELEVVRRDVSSPVELEPGEMTPWISDEWTVELCVRAPGYAWCPIDLLDLAEGGERWFELLPGGDLLVSCQLPGGPVPGFDEVLTLSLNWSVGEPAEDYARGPITLSEPVRIEGLTPGTAEVSIYTQRWRSKAGEATIEILAGQCVEASVVLEAARLKQEEVVLEGRLKVPAAWEWTKDPELWFGMLSRHDDASLAAVEGSPGLFVWTCRARGAGPLLLPIVELRTQLGRVRFELAKIDATAPDSAMLDLVVEEPCPVIFSVEDAESGEPISNWGVSAGGRDRSDDRIWCRDDFQSAQATLYAWPGMWDVWLSARGYEYAQRSIEIHSGTNDVSIRLSRTCEFRLVARVDGLRIPWPRNDESEIEVLDASGNGVLAQGMSWSERFRHVETTGWGSATITIAGEIGGYEPVAPFVVDRRPGEVIEHVLDLVPRRR